MEKQRLFSSVSILITLVLNHLRKVANSAQKEYKRARVRNDKYLIDKARNKIEKINKLLLFARKNKRKYNYLSKNELRRKLYNDGVSVEYILRKRNGEIKKRETIHYKMLFRSTGKAKKGSCIFICDDLYETAKNLSTSFRTKIFFGLIFTRPTIPLDMRGAYALISTTFAFSSGSSIPIYR